MIYKTFDLTVKLDHPTVRRTVRMITFMPFCSFVESLQCLDNKRIVSQVKEAWQMWCCLMNKSNQRWRFHPAVKMWKGYEVALQLYAILALEEAERRITKSGRNYYMPVMRQYMTENGFYELDLSNIVFPHWFGDDDFHNSHKAMLYRKNPIYYKQFEEVAELYEKYYWP